jgi:hypothetical protein
LADPQNPHGAPVRLAQARSRDDPRCAAIKTG